MHSNDHKLQLLAVKPTGKQFHQGLEASKARRLVVLQVVRGFLLDSDAHTLRKPRVPLDLGVVLCAPGVQQLMKGFDPQHTLDHGNLHYRHAFILQASASQEVGSTIDIVE